MICNAVYEDIDEIFEVFKDVDKNPWSRDMISGSFKNENCFFLVLREEGKIAGFVSVMTAADEAEILYIGVRPEFRRRGFGRALLSAANDGAREKGALRIYLELRASNAAALALYESVGYKKIALRRGYYKHPPEDAVLMEMELC